RVAGGCILQPIVVLLELADQVGWSAHHVDDLLTPHGRNQLPDLHLAEIDFDRGAERPGSLGGQPGFDEWHDRHNSPDPRRRGGGKGEELPATVVDLIDGLYVSFWIGSHRSDFAHFPNSSGR